MNLFLRKTLDRSKPNRRDFMVQSTCASLGITSMVNTLSQLQLVGTAAAATNPTDVKALVCIFLAGGNDSNNLLIPRSGPARTEYETSRGLPVYAGGPGGIAIPLAELTGTAITPDNAEVSGPGVGYTNNDFALHPACANLKALFDSQDLAFVTNVGTLTAGDLTPGGVVTRSNFGNPTPTKPPQLFSHSDQVLQWQSSIADEPFTSGWGGRVADYLAPGNAADTAGLAMGVSIAGVNSFQVGITEQPFVMSTAGAQGFSGFGTNYANALITDANNKAFSTGANGYDPLTSTNYDVTQEGWRLRALERLMAMNHANLFDSSFEATAKNARKTEGVVADTLAFTSATSGNDIILDGWFTAAYGGSATAANNDFANQMKMAARLIIGNNALINSGVGKGNHRQTFFIQLGGFDTHASQLAINTNNTVNTAAGQYALLLNLSRAIKGFYDSIMLHPRGGATLWNKVLGFTSSDFNRTFTPNKTDSSGGSDHGWGGHAFVMGGAVKGKKLYGTFPELTVNGGIDCTGARGRWIPSTSVDQYAAKIAEWAGVSSGAIGGIFPNLSRFRPVSDPVANLDFIDLSVT